MMINGFGLAALAIYMGWRLLNFYEQAATAGDKTVMVTDVIYMGFMSYFLLTGSKTFAVILMLSALMNAGIGVVVSMAPVPPEAVSHTTRLVGNLWLFTLIDVVLGGVAYFIMTMWGM